MLTAEGKPLRITRDWFRVRYGQNFPDILEEGYDTLLQTCIDDVYTLFYGVTDLWAHLERTAYEDKTRMCYGLLVAWYIADLYPDLTTGVISSGGMPIKRKKIGGVDLTFDEQGKTNVGAVNNADLLQSLKSNAYGCKAYLMIKTSGKINLYLGR
jgi:hypothetical protein